MHTNDTEGDEPILDGRTPPPPRDAYRAPTLVPLGSLAELTGGAMGSGSTDVTFTVSL